MCEVNIIYIEWVIGWDIVPAIPNINHRMRCIVAHIVLCVVQVADAFCTVLPLLWWNILPWKVFVMGAILRMVHLAT